MTHYAEQIRAFVPRRLQGARHRRLRPLATSATSCASFFEVNRHYIVVAALKALADDGTLPAAKVAEAIDEVRHRRRQDQPAGPSERDRTHDEATRMSTIEVKVPDIGDFKDVPVIEVLVKPGDTVKAEESLVTLESDKATMEIPSPAAGVVKELQGQGRRQGQRRQRAADAGVRRRPRRRRRRLAARRRAAARRAAVAAPPQRPPARRCRASAPRRQRRRDRGQGARHRRLRATCRSSRCWSRPATRSRPSDRWSRSSPTRRRWRSRRPRAGVVKELKVKVGDKVSEGSVDR